MQAPGFQRAGFRVQDPGFVEEGEDVLEVSVAPATRGGAAARLSACRLQESGFSVHVAGSKIRAGFRIQVEVLGVGVEG